MLPSFVDMIQRSLQPVVWTCKRFKRTLFIRTKNSMQIFVWIQTRLFIRAKHNVQNFVWIQTFIVVEIVKASKINCHCVWQRDVGDSMLFHAVMFFMLTGSYFRMFKGEPNQKSIRGCIDNDRNGIRHRGSTHNSFSVDYSSCLVNINNWKFVTTWPWVLLFCAQHAVCMISVMNNIATCGESVNYTMNRL